MYLTLVRDKIDQLIAQGDVISPQSKPDGLNKELDDLDLWDSIKRAPFDRLGSPEPEYFGDASIMSKGRLMIDGKGFRFTEDERSKEKCGHGNATCADGVKAYWSVKRVRQRDEDSSQGKYHYELTFSVITQSPKLQKRPYENPTRTFTVRESSPETIVDQPSESRTHDPQTQAPRGERALWFHKNIIPTPRYQARQYQNGLDRIFGSLFSDDDDYEVIRYRTVPAQTQAPSPQHSKVGYVGASSEQNQQHKKYVPYPYKPHTIKYARPVLQPVPPHPHHYLDMDSIGVVSAPYDPQYQDNKYLQPGNQPAKYTQPGSQDNRHVQPGYVVPANQEHKYVQPANQDYKYTQTGPLEHKYIQTGSQEHKYLQPGNQYILGKPYKQVRPPILPTPLPPIQQNSDNPFENATVEESKTKAETTPVFIHQTNTTRAPEQTTSHSKPRPAPIKVSYFPEHVRPPVYNAPPGIFVTMDKKPFKPMPPLRYHSSKPIKVHKPIDFRPSPQILDVQSLEPVVDGAFRPITVKYDNETTTEKNAVEESTKPAEKVTHDQKATLAASKPIHKKHENKKTFTTAPTLDIITAQVALEEDSDLHWANLLGAFSKTTPMGAHKEKHETETTTSVTTSTTVKSTSKLTTEKAKEVPITTTPASKKRTRPPPKFTKPEKVKKHKRGSSTTTNAPEKQKHKRPLSDLTPQASSSSAGKQTTKWTPPSTTHSTSSSSPSTITSNTTTAPTTTTSRPTTTEAPKTTTTTTTTEPPTATERPKSANRYRQSTLMYKGTSVKHDKWSGYAADSNFKRPTGSGVPPPRRKGSNFQGYVTSSTSKPTDDDYYEDIPNSSETPKSSTTEALVSKVQQQVISSGTKTTQSIYEDTVDQYEAVSEAHTAAESGEEDEEGNHAEEETEQQETKDRTEFMFYPKSTTPNDRTNEIDDPNTTEQTVATTPHYVAKNKTKCKKKKKPTTTEAYDFEEEDVDASVLPVSKTTTTEAPVTPDIFDDLFGGFTFDADDQSKEDKDTTPRPAQDQDEEESENHEKYVKLVEDEDFEDFLDELDKEEGNAKSDESFYNEDEKDESEEAFDDDVDDEQGQDGHGDENKQEARGTQEYDDIEHSPYSLFELMAME